ncbi:MAG: MFS transporter [Dehalococcoidia bacterium]|nr:MFS transporter [Dehalococcoidia bacterium]
MSGPASFTRDIFAKYGAALAFPDYRIMWTASLSAGTAAWALIVARGWFIYQANERSSDVAIVTFSALLPALIVPPIVGVYADRLDRKKILAASYAANLAANLLLAALGFADILGVTEMLGLPPLLGLWQVVVLSIVNGAARYTQMTVSQALAANLVPRNVLLNALSLNRATNQFSRLVGAAAVTPILAVVGAPFAFLVCTGLYGVGWFLTMRIKTVSTGTAKAGESFFSNLAGGFRYIRTQPLIMMVIVMVCFHCSLTMGFESTLPAFARQRLGSTEMFGVLMTAVGVGSLFGSIYVGGISSALLRGRLLLVTGVLSGFGQVMLSFAPDIAFAYVAAVLMGATQAAFMTLGEAITQAVADDGYRGRVASVNTMSFQGLMAVMNLSNGVMSDIVGPQLVLVATGSAFMLIMLGGFLVATSRDIYVNGIPDRAMTTAQGA